jgi:hypothetical protein
MCIKFFCGIFLCVVAFIVDAEEDFISVGVSLQEYWDSNFSRSPNAVREHISVGSASVALNKKLSRQAFSARWKLMDYHHRFREDLDTSLQLGKIAWKGSFGEKWSTDAFLLRDAYAVDRLEFVDKDAVIKDIVAKDDAVAKIGYGSGERFAFYLGGRFTEQQHSAKLRESLNYDENETFSELSYKTLAKSFLIARYKTGDRQYLDVINRVNESNSLNFDYQQIELESTLLLTPKTQVNYLLAYFERDGVINDGHGALANLNLSWAASDKQDVKIGYALKKPAVGELSDSPFDVRRTFAAWDWKLSEKIRFSVNGYVEKQNFNNGFSMARKEKVTVLSPFNMSYHYSETVSVSVNSEKEVRESLLAYRDYSSLQAKLGVFLQF